MLTDFYLPSRANSVLLETGVDSISECADLNTFKSWPYPISYRFNDRGFRDHAWPGSHTDLKEAIWCLGDSFTVGVGSPFEHTWPQQLRSCGFKTINVSLDGASNKWIGRKALRLLNEVKPKVIVIHWSYLHRREISLINIYRKWWPEFYKSIKDTQWPECASFDRINELPLYVRDEIRKVHNFYQTPVTDEDRRLWAKYKSTPEEDAKITKMWTDKVERHKGSTKVIHSFIPLAGDNTEGIINQNAISLGMITQLDVARDGHHYDIVTSKHLVASILNHL